MLYNTNSLEKLLEEENKLVEKYERYMNQVESGEIRKLCGELLYKHSIHMSTLEKYMER